MNKHMRFFVLWGVILFSLACNINVTPTPMIAASPTPALSLVVQVQNPTDIFDSIGDEIRYNYIVTNNSGAPLTGPVTVTDNIATVTCPELTAIGNQNNTLDPGETITCSGAYRLTQAALDARSVANSATVSAGGGSAISAPGGTTVKLTSFTPGKTLGLAKTAEPLTYNSVGQTITFKYVITNTGTLAIGPTQFMITDDRISGPFPCGTDPATTLNPGATLSCTANYTISQQDMGVSSVTNTATASGGDAQPSAAASATITNSTLIPSVTPGSSNLPRGATIQHQVVKGEWLFQIARCYGVDYKSLRNANLNIPNPSLIDPGQIVTVPNIGSAGTIYGPPCVIYYTVAAGDTWNSIATRYNARLDVLQEVNPKGLVVGAQIKVPVNSAGGNAVQVPVTGGATSTNTPLTATATATGTATATATVTVTGTATATPTVTATNTPVTATSTASPTATATLTSTPVTVTPTIGTANPSLGAQPNRITIPPGSNSATQPGTLISHETVSYVVAASQGQTMTVNLAANPSEIGMRIHQPSGLLIKPLDGNLTWTGILPVSGDFRIDLVGLTDPNKNYILTVTVTSP